MDPLCDIYPTSVTICISKLVEISASIWLLFDILTYFDFGHLTCMTVNDVFSKIIGADN